MAFIRVILGSPLTAAPLKISDYTPESGGVQGRKIFRSARVCRASKTRGCPETPAVAGAAHARVVIHSTFCNLPFLSALIYVE